MGRPQPLDAASGQDNSGGNLESRRCAVMPRAQYSRPNSLHAATREEIVVEGVLAHNASLSTTVLGGGLAVVPRQLTAGQKSYTNSGHSILPLTSFQDTSFLTRKSRLFPRKIDRIAPLHVPKERDENGHRSLLASNQLAPIQGTFLLVIKSATHSTCLWEEVSRLLCSLTSYHACLVEPNHA